MDELTLEEVIAINTVDTITPSPIVLPTDDQKAQIRVLLEAGYSPTDIFIKAYLPLERVIAVQAEIAAEKAEAQRLIDEANLPPTE